MAAKEESRDRVARRTLFSVEVEPKSSKIGSGTVVPVRDPQIESGFQRCFSHMEQFSPFKKPFPNFQKKSGRGGKRSPFERTGSPNRPLRACFLCHQGPYARQCTKHLRGKTRKQPECFLCGSRDHWKRDCLWKDADKGEGNGRNPSSSQQ